MYLNVLAEELSSKTKLFVDDTSVFCGALNISVTQLNNDLVEISKWEYMENKFPVKFPVNMPKTLFLV